ncbi:hypothetical protein Ahy_A03g014067 [Arachis hypogaea]|uniref:Uncharacterized protein n=1 Tax=Arachis hypogaea TaxID=3818 RepID=A0A445DWW9_ARAHY|nr:hypothetical protein Ahy_A03g014067 [Arachis hypogaea]
MKPHRLCTTHHLVLSYELHKKMEIYKLTKDYWLREGIIAKVMSKALAEKGYAAKEDPAGHEWVPALRDVSSDLIWSRIKASCHRAAQKFINKEIR